MIAQLKLGFDLPLSPAQTLTNSIVVSPPPRMALSQRQDWLCLHFPQLDLLAQQNDKTDQPFALITGEGARARVHACNAIAQDFGVRAGMRIGTACALCGHLLLQTHDAQRSTRFLQQMGHWAQQFTPAVSLKPPYNLLLEVRASLYLFNGAENLALSILQALRDIRMPVQMAYAETPLAALWLARSNPLNQAQQLSEASARERLASLPLTSGDFEEKRLQRLQQLGLQNLRDVWRLPRGDFARRYGRDTLQMLDRASGEIADIPVLLAQPEVFIASGELDYECSETLRLHVYLRALAEQISSQLALKAYGSQHFVLHMQHADKTLSHLPIGLAQATRDALQIQSLLQIRLEAQALHSPVRALALQALHPRPLNGSNASLFARSAEASDLDQVLTQLRARLGDHCIQQACTVAEHRPEYNAQQKPWYSTTLSARQQAMTMNARDRPLLLLDPPQALAGLRSLKILRGPERIETGWWQGEDIRRDYFVARNARGALWWIFREGKGERRWFKHGVFA